MIIIQYTYIYVYYRVFIVYIQDADIAAAPMFITEKRSEVIDFTEPFLEVQATIIMKRQQRVTITSIADLLHQPQYTIGIRDQGMVTRAFRKTNDTTYRKIWKQIRRRYHSSFTSSNEQGISRARNGGFAFLLPSNIAEYVARQKPCDLVTIDRFLLNDKFALALPKGSGLVDKLNRALFLLEDDGFLDRLYDKWWIQKNDCVGIQYSKMYSLNSRAAQVDVVSVLSIFVKYICLYIIVWLLS